MPSLCLLSKDRKQPQAFVKIAYRINWGYGVTAAHGPLTPTVQVRLLISLPKKGGFLWIGIGKNSNKSI